MSLLTKSQASRAKGRAKARAGAARARARRRARPAAAQARPLAASARTTARKGIHHARIWAAPRLERTGHALEEQSTTMPTEVPSHLAASDANGRVRTG